MKPNSGVIGVEVAAHLPVLRAGLRWLYETEQADGAVLQHHGESLWSAGNRTISFIPAAWAGHVVIVVDVTHVEYSPAPPHRPINPLEPHELVAFSQLLAEVGQDVVRTWNGHPAITGSLALARRAHPSLLAAVQLYRAGCGVHESVFCRCGGYADGNQRLKHLHQILTAGTGSEGRAR